jgi:hypothetical protein
MVHQANTAIFKSTLESIVSRPGDDHIVLFLRCTASRHPGLRLRGHSESQ